MGKTKSTIVMDSDLWKRFRMIAIMNEMEISELVEQALREKLERMKQLEEYPEYKDVEGLQVQRSRSQSPQQKRQLPTYQEIKEYHNKLTNELKSKKILVDKDGIRAHEILAKFIKNIADERNIEYIDATVLIWNDDNLYQELSDKLGTSKEYGIEKLRFEAAMEIMGKQQQPQSQEKEKIKH